MPYLRGEDINIGVGIEESRGTIVSPQVWIPGRTPTGVVPIIEKIEMKETRASGIDTQGAEIVQKRAEGDLEFNVRCASIGYLLKSWLGKCTTDPTPIEADAVWSHLFEILPQDPEHPSLSLGLSQPNSQDYEYGLALVKTLEIRTPVDDLVNATVGFLAAKEQARAGSHTVAFESNDYPFRHQDVVVKMADIVTTETTAAANWTATKAALAAAAKMSLKEFSFGGDNGARINQNIGEENPGNVLAVLASLKATLKADFLENLDQTLGGIGAATPYTVLDEIEETDEKNKKLFTPTDISHKNQTKVVFKVKTIGTGDWTIVVHSSTNVLMASETIKKEDLIVGYNTAILPWTWAAGQYHIHIISSVANGIVDTDVISSLEGAKMSFYYESERELYTEGKYKAMRLEMEREDIMIGTVSTQHPKLTIDFARVSFEGWTPDRPLEDIVAEGVELKVHYDPDNAIAIEATLINEQENYLKA